MSDIINQLKQGAEKLINNAEKFSKTAVKKEIGDMLGELKKLYKTAFKLIDDYNAYVPAQHIECLTGVRYYENVYASFYYLVAAVIGFSFLCLLAVTLEIMKRYAEYANDAKNGT